MPIVVSNEGWVKVAPSPVKRRGPPPNPVNAFRGPLAYITGRPEFKEPVKKQPIKQLLIETIPPPPPIIEERAPRRSKRVPSAPVPSKSKNRAQSEILEEADEEIIRSELDDVQSRRSASPAASRYSRAAPSVRSRRDPPRPVYEDDQDIHKHSRSKRQLAGRSRSEYHADSYSESRQHHRSDRLDRNYRDSYHRERERDHYYGVPHHYSSSHLAPPIQPIVIYSTPPLSAGCGGHHGCHNHAYQQHQFYANPQPLLQAAPSPVSAALPAPTPRAPPSEISSKSSGSKTSRAMSYKWYTATQPLDL